VELRCLMIGFCFDLGESGLQLRVRAADVVGASESPVDQAGRHQHPEYLRVRLAKLGIDCRAQRRAALLQLGSEVPPVVLADMLNLAPSTAMKWVDWAGGNWAHYVAERMRRNARRGESGEPIESEGTSMSYSREGSA
jgi:hypothetical protein